MGTRGGVTARKMGTRRAVTPPRPHFSRGHLFFKANARRTLRKNRLCEKIGTARSLNYVQKLIFVLTQPSPGRGKRQPKMHPHMKA